MKKAFFSRALIVAISLASLLGFAAVPLSAQTPSADQAEMFRNMSPEQQRAALDALGRSGNGGTSATRPRQDRSLDFPQLTRPRQENQPEEDTTTTTADGRIVREPRLKGEDTILLQLDIREYEGFDPSEWQTPSPLLPQQNPLQPQLPGTLPNNSANPQTAGATVPQQQMPPAEDDLTRRKVRRTESEFKELQEFRDRLHRRNPYRLDKSGVLNIPELGPIPLAGLTIEQAKQRLTADPNLRNFKVYVTRLPLKPIGTEALKPFGYDSFDEMATTFAPATDIPVPAEYVVGPGDTFEVQLIGNVKGRYLLVVGRDGRVDFPELGPIPVSGMRFEQARDMLERRVSEQMIGTRASITIGELRSIRVLVAGDANRTGTYTVSGLSTITNALLISGGVKKIGSLRNIELKRNGVVVTHFDLYDVLLKGDTRGDARLLPGDTIFIPPVGVTASMSGEVRRPAIYELKGGEKMSDLVALAGGLTAQADPKLATVERVNDDRQRIIVDVDLTGAQAKAMTISNGDVLRVPVIRPSLENSVSVTGYVYRPGEFQYRKGLRLSDVIPSLDELRSNGDQHYVLIRRELPPDRRITVFSADLARALASRGGREDIELAPRDRLYAFDLESGRDLVVDPLMRDLRTQSTYAAPTQQVNVSGRVKVPGKYPLEPGMRVSDLVRAGGSLAESAYGGSAELTRYEVVNGQSREIELQQIDLAKALAGDPTADLVLHPFDNLLIKETPLWAQQEEVIIRGEVRFPGPYTIHRGETLRSVIDRAGGLTNFAFVEGAVFTRKESKERERKQLDSYANRMQSDIAVVSLQVTQETGKDAGSALAVGQSLLASLRSTQPVGRVVVDLRKTQKAAAGSENEVFLKDGDLLVVPRITQEVAVLGEVNGATSHLYKSGLSLQDYIDLSGGLTARADKNGTYVMRADGSVLKQSRRWFGGGNIQIKPGDSIVVPLDTERIRPLPLWTAVAQIVSNLAISAAALASFQ